MSTADELSEERIADLIDAWGTHEENSLIADAVGLVHTLSADRARLLAENTRLLSSRAGQIIRDQRDNIAALLERVAVLEAENAGQYEALTLYDESLMREAVKGGALTRENARLRAVAEAADKIDRCCPDHTPVGFAALLTALDAWKAESKDRKEEGADATWAVVNFCPFCGTRVKP